MKVVVTGSAGHLGEGLMRTLTEAGVEAVGLDVEPSSFTTVVGSINDQSLVEATLADAAVVYHAATLHKPHVATHGRQAFVDVNVAGTLTLLEAAVQQGVERFVFTSTTSVYGAAMRPPPGAPAVWVTEATQPVPRNIYGVTKRAAEDLCELFHRTQGLACVVLRTSRFFLEVDDDPAVRGRFEDGNVKLLEYLNRRVDLEDVVDAHLLAAEHAPALGFGRYIVSATSPFVPEDCVDLDRDLAGALARRVPDAADVFDRLGWQLPDRLDRVYDNAAARRDLAWRPRWNFARGLALVEAGELPVSALARAVGVKGYHEAAFDEGPYPVD